MAKIEPSQTILPVFRETRHPLRPSSGLKTFRIGRVGTTQMSATNPKYGCKHCDYSCAKHHFVNHLLRNHTNELKATGVFSIENATIKKNSPVQHHVKFDGCKDYSVYICLTCNTMYSTKDKCIAHMEKENCNAKHQEKAKELLATIRDETPAVGGAGTPTTTTATADNSELLKELEKLKRENAALKEQNEKLKQENTALKSSNNTELAEKVEDLEWKVEELELGEYKFERLRYALLFGSYTDTYGNKIPYLPPAQRQKFICTLEDRDWMPFHKNEPVWYDLLQGDDNNEPTHYKFPIDYEAE